MSHHPTHGRLDRPPGEVVLPPRQPVSVRRRLYEIMELGHGEDRTSHVFDTALVILIILNVAAFVAESVPSLHAAYGRQFALFELFSVGVFTLEYGTRLWIAVEVPYLQRLSPFGARLKFARSPAQIIDLLAVLPFYLGQLFAIDLRVLRALRILRLLKLSRYSPAMHTLIRVISNERRALSGAALLLAAAVLFASTGIHFLESDA
ncbi:MAG: ion transporter, partial [Hyphomicrobium sp.]